MRLEPRRSHTSADWSHSYRGQPYFRSSYQIPLASIRGSRVCRNPAEIACCFKTPLGGRSEHLPAFLADHSAFSLVVAALQGTFHRIYSESGACCAQLWIRVGTPNVFKLVQHQDEELGALRVEIRALAPSLNEAQGPGNFRDALDFPLGEDDWSNSWSMSEDDLGIWEQIARARPLIREGVYRAWRCPSR
jgi:hypothetical protein